ncbi:MAG: hypothetical protein H6734_14645 [Alphaproteobacteria bacterium]|nr:hypothetical protein [Alphaproteobacteria bacterium]
MHRRSVPEQEGVVHTHGPIVGSGSEKHFVGDGRIAILAGLLETMFSLSFDEVGQHYETSAGGGAGS